MTMQESHSRKSMGMSACDAKARQREQGAARWHGTTRSRSSLAISTAGQRGGALDQWFEATTHTFNPKCASAADEASAASWEARIGLPRGTYEMNCRILFQAGVKHVHI